MGKNLPGYATVDIRTVALWPVNAQPNALYTKQKILGQTNVREFKTDGEFKTWFNNHTRSFGQKNYSADTELSKYIGKLSRVCPR